MTKKLYRSEKEKILAGVCGGIAEYFSIDPTIVRIAAVLILLGTHVAAVVVYILCAIIIPKREEYNTNYNDNDMNASTEKSIISTEKNRTLLGLILVCVGVVFLLKKYLMWIKMEYIWAILLIIIGIVIIFRRKKDE